MLLPEWPVFGMADDVREALQRIQAAGGSCALATLIAAEGGAPRPVGTQMVFAPGVVSGYFSGGCVEGDIAHHAMACLEDGTPRTLVYGAGSPWPDIRLLCGARIEIFVERVSSEDVALRDLLLARAERRSVTWVSDGVSRQCGPDVSPWPEARVVRRHDPVPKLIVLGVDPTALALAQLGAQSGFETTLISSMGPTAPPPIADIAYRREAPAQALAAIGIDEWTAIAIATHDEETDHTILRETLTSPASYVGLLGARRRLPGRLDRLRAEGVPSDALARLRAPIGLDIGGKAPWEIAVAAIGEIVAARRKALA